jgi:uncharacterized membrane protein (UPF0127 family)
MRRAAVSLVLAALVLSACSSSPPTERSTPATQLAIQTRERAVRIDVEVADDDAERRVGLMGRASLAADAGMVFLFPQPVRTSFWMKDTLIPLSIAFWNGDGRIVAILDMEPCEADPCPSYDPGVEFTGALEVNQGYFEENGVRLGDRVELLEPQG